MPQSFRFFLGRSIGGLICFFDIKHRAIAYANIKAALADLPDRQAGKFSPPQLKKVLCEFYRAFGQSLIEIFLIPLVDKKYVDKYISFEGLDNIALGFKEGRGVILLAAHAGSWELYNIISSYLSFPFSLFVRDQAKFPRLEKLLNNYRAQKGCRIIQRGNQLQELIGLLKRNESIGLTVDQGGKNGTLVNFFGSSASMSTGAIKLALKYDTAVIPVFFVRLNGPYVKIIIQPPFEVKKTGNLKEDIRDNLQRVVLLFEKYIAAYPKEYLWTYRVWKYSQNRKILILSDAKIGHLRQAQSAANIAADYLRGQMMSVSIDTVEVKFKNNFLRKMSVLSGCLTGKYVCQGCLRCMRVFLKKESYDSLARLKPDIVISCGSQAALVNYLLSRENLAKSIVIMRPSILSTRRFDLVIMPRHDGFLKRKNIVVTDGALNLINEEYLKGQSEKLTKLSAIRYPLSATIIGLLIGGDSKNFSLGEAVVAEVIKQVKLAAQNLGADILITTSRRTSPETEELIKMEFTDYPRCKLLIIANEKNIPEVVGGILSLSRIIIVSPESISMISESVSSAKCVVVFKADGLSIKHSRFLEFFAKNKYIYLSEPYDLSRKIESIIKDKPFVQCLKDNLAVSEAIKKIL